MFDDCSFHTAVGESAVIEFDASADSQSGLGSSEVVSCVC